jgi:hypothetical protein
MLGTVLSAKTTRLFAKLFGIAINKKLKRMMLTRTKPFVLIV